MLVRLLAVLALLAGGLVVGWASPAAACSCVTDDPVELAAAADVAFVGVLGSQRTGDGVVAHLFDVEAVHRGDVRRGQDVVTPGAGDSCGVEWTTGTRMVVLGRLDEDGRVAADLCSGSVPTTDASYDATVQALGPAHEPLAGRSLVDLSAMTARDLAWSAATAGVVGLLGMLAVRRLARRSAPR